MRGKISSDGLAELLLAKGFIGVADEVVEVLQHEDRRVGRPEHEVERRLGRARLGIDCGWRDQYHIHFGTRTLSKRLASAGIAHTYEEFDDNHSDVDYRMDVSLPFLYKALKP